MFRFSLEGKVALITGGRRGIGKAIALGFADVGADVAVCDLVIEGGELEAVTQEIRKFGRRSLAVQADVTKEADINNMVERVEKELGAIDILVSNAGIGGGPRLMETELADWQKMIDTDLTGYYICCRAVGKRMAARKKGNIITIASAAGIRGFAARNAYNVAKAGVIMLTKVMCRDWGRYNIRVNAIAPSSVRTTMMRPMNKEQEEAEAARIPLGRISEVDDIVGPAIFLASDASSYVTGHTLLVDGGQLA